MVQLKVVLNEFHSHVPWTDLILLGSDPDKIIGFFAYLFDCFPSDKKSRVSFQWFLNGFPTLSEIPLHWLLPWSSRCNSSHIRSMTEFFRFLLWNPLSGGYLRLLLLNPNSRGFVRLLLYRVLFLTVPPNFSVPKWKTMGSQSEILFHEILDVQKILVGWTTFFFLALKFGRTSQKTTLYFFSSYNLFIWQRWLMNMPTKLTFDWP